MRKNFSIRGFAELLVDGQAIDLHNLYSATSICTDATGNTITVTFGREDQCPSPPSVPESVTLTCSGNLKLAFKDLEARSLHDDAVEIAYYDGHCAWDQFLDEDLAENQGFEGLHLSFSGGFVLRISSATAEVSAA